MHAHVGRVSVQRGRTRDPPARQAEGWHAEQGWESGSLMAWKENWQRALEEEEEEEEVTRDG